MNVYFLHYSCEPAQKTDEIQGGYADTCCIAASVVEADALSRSLILSHRWIVQDVLAASERTPRPDDDWDEIELMLWGKAQQRSPQAAVLFSAWGTGEQAAQARLLGIPDEGRPQ